jgi:hypothetical protein
VASPVGPQEFGHASGGDQRLRRTAISRIPRAPSRPSGHLTATGHGSTGTAIPGTRPRTRTTPVRRFLYPARFLWSKRLTADRRRCPRCSQPGVGGAAHGWTVSRCRGLGAWRVASLGSPPTSASGRCGFLPLCPEMRAADRGARDNPSPYGTFTRQDATMKDLPRGLPPANSRKWHSRRWWDQLGYLRARSLANPNWSRDIPWLIRRLRRERSTALSEDLALYDQAVIAAQNYARSPVDSAEAERAWDRVLEPIDELLTRRQARHLDNVRRARAGEGDLST